MDCRLCAAFWASPESKARRHNAHSAAGQAHATTAASNASTNAWGLSSAVIFSRIMFTGAMVDWGAAPPLDRAIKFTSAWVWAAVCACCASSCCRCTAACRSYISARFLDMSARAVTSWTCCCSVIITTIVGCQCSQCSLDSYILKCVVRAEESMMR